MKKLLIVTLSVLLVLSLAACGNKPGDTPSGGNSTPAGQPTTSSSSQQEPESTPDEADTAPSEKPEESGEALAAGWPTHEWLSVIPEADGTVIKSEFQKDSGANGAYVIYMEWTDEQAQAYGEKLKEAGYPVTVDGTADNGSYNFMSTKDGCMVQVGELGETENDYIIAVFKL